MKKLDNGHLRTFLEKMEEGSRINSSEFMELANNASLLQLGVLADTVRRRKHPEGRVTYVVDRNINYTNICTSGCKFCAFFVAPGDTHGYVLSNEELKQKIEETKTLGGTQILLQGGLHPDLGLNFYVDMVHYMHSLGIHVHGFSPPEIQHFAQLSKKSVDEVLDALIEAGLGSIPGGGAEILDDRPRNETSPRKCNTSEWLEVMEKAHKKGLRTTATMMFGHVETMEERLAHLTRVRDLQDRTGGFTAFISWPFQPGNTLYEGQIEKATAHEYLAMLALSRIYLDNFDNVQASWVTQGAKIAQISLSFGANDFGSTMIEENVVAAAGVTFRLSQEEIRRLVKDAGFTPAQRFMDYSLV
ncbi:dehypoxanthine futalosine cyclase [Desulforhopalus vacuolatus]|uniref:cyclic dehypoxanthinyl futalosine synthase n=1 Tax=Desulforhopalus vacuolatus TaxID=40414 RepID=UPI001966BA85|nr:cyclic dehypoxanthinyl futalosine synthase [Desulforhopalus vacuolatus]MBM9520640.1 dehypoxanthine futalosine cyclase [Desulforhopalus vacuolatus]